MTLFEIMIVIFLIGLIASVIGYNMKGSLDEGKAFKTRQAKEQIHDILLLEYANNSQSVSLDEIARDAERYLTAAGIVKNPKELLKDGWGKPFKITAIGSDLKITSQALNDYNQKKDRIKNSAEKEAERDEEEEN